MSATTYHEPEDALHHFHSSTNGTTLWLHDGWMTGITFTDYIGFDFHQTVYPFDFCGVLDYN